MHNVWAYKQSELTAEPKHSIEQSSIRLVTFAFFPPGPVNVIVSSRIASDVVEITFCKCVKYAECFPTKVIKHCFVVHMNQLSVPSSGMLCLPVRTGGRSVATTSPRQRSMNAENRSHTLNHMIISHLKAKYSVL
jgi:hypothetical protein